MCFTNDDFLDDLDFGGPQSFDINRKDRPEEFNAEESEKNQIILQYPPVEKPLLFFSDLKKNTVTKKLTDVKKGTTTLAFVYKSGILIAVDSRASMGSYIASKTVRKVTEINSYLLGTIAGGASDCQFWERQLSFWCKLYELRHGTRVPVTAASEVLCDWVAQYRGRGLSMGTMICGYDGDEQKIFLVEDDGTRIQGNLFSVGSGSTHAYGVLDSKWKYDMTTEEAVALGREAIHHATHRDCGSGGVCRVYNLTKDGWKIYIEAEDVDKIHDELENKKGMRGDGLEAGQDPFGY
jgi:20S proteasome subunit beta 5